LDRLLTSAAGLYVAGVPVNWLAAFAGSGARRVDLPTYAFQRQRYWLTVPDADTTSTSSSTLDSEQSVLKLVCSETAAVLGKKDTDLIGADLATRMTETFKDLGFNSSMTVRLRNRLTAVAGVRLPATVAFSYPTPQALGRHIFSLLEPKVPETPEAAGEGRGDDELYELIDRGYV
jgi:acyl carrier protein